jgi:serine/threonine-protein kinase
MEYIRGVTLDALLHSNRRLEPARVGRLLYQICEVLQAAHGEGIIHRDLKPANLMVVDPDSQYELIKVMDFGLAKLLGPDAKAAVTNHEFAVGTPGYMCPEQAKGEEMDHRGDLYSIGVVLFELLTGQLPFAGRETMDVLLAHATEEPPSFARLGVAGQVPPAIERVVQWCLAKEPSQRPRHARELSEAFTAALGDCKPQQPKEALTKASRPVKVRPPLVPPAAVAVPVVPVAEPASSAAPPPPEPVVVKSPATPTPPTLGDALAVVHHLEAWMPEKIATYKLRGFIQDAGGELVESVPGRINVRLGGKNCPYSVPTRGLSWLGLGRRPGIDIELRLQRGDNGHDNRLKITVVFRSSNGSDVSGDAAWRAVCTQIYCDLRGYLMGQTGDVTG